MGDIFLFPKGLSCKMQICKKQVWVGESHALASDDGASQRKLMCLCAVYQFPADLKSSILADVRSACFGGALTSASSVLALLGRWNDFWWLMISNWRKPSQCERHCWCFRNWCWLLVKEKFSTTTETAWQNTLWVLGKGSFWKPTNLKTSPKGL